MSVVYKRTEVSLMMFVFISSLLDLCHSSHLARQTPWPSEHLLNRHNVRHSQQATRSSSPFPRSVNRPCLIQKQYG